MALTFGKVPRPPIVNRIIPSTDTACWDDLGQRNPVGTCVHRMHGTLLGTDDYFRGGGACQEDPNMGGLTDFGIGGQLEIQFGHPELDGVIYQWNDPVGRRSPYANGAANDLERNGPAYVDYYGVDGVNRNLVSIELSGYADADGQVQTPMTPKQFESLCWLIAYYHDYAKVSWDLFPVHPVSSVVTCLEHWEFATKECPYSIVRGLREKYLARAREIMKFYQTGGIAASPPPGTGLPGDGTSGNVDTGKPSQFRVNDKIKNKMDNDINLRAGPSTSSAIVTTLIPGKILCVTGTPTSNEGHLWYPVNVVSGGQTGFVAGELCNISQKNGCGIGSPPGKFAIGDRIVAREDVNLRSTPGTGGTTAPFVGMAPTDPLRRTTSRGTVNDAYAWARANASEPLDEVIAYIDEMYRICALDGLDAAILIAQSSHETTAWTSPIWRTRLNPAGIGVTGSQDLGYSFPSGVAAARAQLVHMHAYVYGTSRALPSGLSSSDDPRYQAVFDANYDDTVDEINDLTGKWAGDPDYHTGICAHGNEIYGEAVRSSSIVIPAESVIQVLTAGTEFCVVGGPQTSDGYEWYQIKYNDQTGWVAAAYCEIKQADGCAGGTGGAFAVGDKIRVFDGPLNYRNAPSTSGTILGQYATDTLLCVTDGPTASDGYTWYRVPAGWLAGNFCESYAPNVCGGAGDFAVNDRIVVSDGPLNYRATPSLSGTVLGQHTTGTLLCVTAGPEDADGYTWYQTTNGGWVASKFCGLHTAGGCATSTPTGHYSRGDGLWVMDPPVNVRDAPTTSSNIIGQYEYQSEVCVIDGPEFANGYEWYYVRGGGLSGWVAEEFFGLINYGSCGTRVDDQQFSIGDVIEVTDGPINARSTAGLSGTIVGSFPQWQQLKVIAGPIDEDGYLWYRVSSSITGWVAGTYCELVASGGAPFMNAASLTTPAKRIWHSGVQAGDIVRAITVPVTVRATASTSGTVVGSLIEGRDRAVVTGAMQVNTEFWFPVAGRFGEGWVNAREVRKDLNLGWAGNLVANPTADTNFNYITAIGGTTLTRVTKDGNTAVKCESPGAQTNEGLKYESATLNEEGRRLVVGAFDVVGTGLIDQHRLRVMYSDGSTSLFTSSPPGVTLSSTTWKRIVTDTLASDPLKTISKVELWIRRSGATAQTFWTDNAMVAIIDIG